MAKIKLGASPETFKKIVKFPLLDGSEGSIEMIYQYRTRTQFGAFIDEIMAAAEVAPTVDEDGKPDFSLADLMKKTAGQNADYILRVAKGWNVEEREFTRENVELLADELPAAATAIMETYRMAVSEGRLGN